MIFVLIILNLFFSILLITTNIDITSDSLLTRHNSTLSNLKHLLLRMYNGKIGINANIHYYKGEKYNPINNYGYLYQPKIKDPAKILILILSNTNNNIFRIHIRSYLQQYKTMNISYIFVLQKSFGNLSIDELSAEDILQVNYTNSHYNNGVAVIETYKWLASNNYKFDYVLKTDEDCTINICKLLNDLVFMDAETNVFGGNCHYYDNLVLPKSNNRIMWSNGAGYILRMEDIPKVLNEIKYLEEIIHSDDRHIPLVSQIIGLRCYSINNFMVLWNRRNYTMNLSKYTIIHNINNFTRTISVWSNIVNNKC